MLTDNQLQNFKSKLESERDRLMAEINKASVVPDLGQDLDGGDEEADEAEEFSNNLANAQTFKDRVQEIDDALARLREGTYGVCVKCGAELSEAMLAAVPESTMCEKCKLGLGA